MKKVRLKPSEVAKIKSRNVNWFDKLSLNDQAWICELIQEIATVQDPAYHSIALSVIEIINPRAHENTIVRLLKRKVKQCQNQKRNPAK